jgi:hypothetical protein
MSTCGVVGLWFSDNGSDPYPLIWGFRPYIAKNLHRLCVIQSSSIQKDVDVPEHIRNPPQGNALEILKIYVHYRVEARPIYEAIIPTLLSAVTQSQAVPAQVKSLIINLNDMKFHWEGVSDAIRTCTNLTTLELASDDLFDEHFERILPHSIEALNQLRSLNISAGNIGPSSANIIAQIVSKHTQLVELSLRHCKQLADAGVSIICEALKGHPCLSTLDMSCMRLTSKCSYSISLMIQSVPSLLNLDISSNLLDGSGLTHIMSVLYNSNLELISVSPLNVTIWALPWTPKRLRLPKSLKSLHLDNLPSSAMRDVVQYASFCSLTTLEFGSTKYPIPVEFAKFVGTSSTLQSLVLVDTPLEEKFGSYLAESLQQNRSLEKLSWHGKYLNDEHLIALCDGLRVNISLSDLSLGNEITELGIQHLSEVLRENRSLEFLSICSKKYGKAGTLQLTEVAKNMQSLVFLGLTCNEFHVEMEEALKTSTSLIGVNCCHNPKVFADVLKQNQMSFLNRTKLYLLKLFITNVIEKSFQLEKGLIGMVLHLAGWDVVRIG